MTSISRRIHDKVCPTLPARDPNPEYETFTEGLRARGITGGEEFNAEVSAQFPNNTERVAYCEWFASPLKKRRSGGCKPEEHKGQCLTAPELIDFPPHHPLRKVQNLAGPIEPN
ncbi:MAG: hypothetical protein Q9184_004758 [Pyrenodesmia sp. 2 TL-2023]